jgi:NADH-quinone oxidoreductase subunit J
VTAVFWVTAVIAIISGLNVILQRNPIYSALFLVANLFCVAIFYLLLNAQFLAAVQIIVYAGAIMVLFLFVITLLSPGREESGEDRLSLFRIPAVVLGVILAALLGSVLASNPIRGASGGGAFQVDGSCPAPDAHHLGGGLGCVSTVGDQLFNNYLFPFELTSLLLLLAMVGAVALAKRKIN